MSEENFTKSNNTNENLQKIINLIYQRKNVFITGHAGTGKSFILERLKEKIPLMLITSTTGIAAVNVKGQTIHSWSGVGICNKPVQDTVKNILGKSSLKDGITGCFLLAVDEISMLNKHTFEYIDKVLRAVKKQNKPFGGIQLIVIGDFYQIPPVEVSDVMKNGYCFESPLWKDFDFRTVVLRKTYRQKDENLINALSHIRINKATPKDINLFKSRICNENDIPRDVLHCFAKNYPANLYNRKKFMELETRQYDFVAYDTVCHGDKFCPPENEYEKKLFNSLSTYENLSLKEGARVMLLINLDFEKGLINGSCGNIQKICQEYISVRFDNGNIADIRKHEFEIYKNEKIIAKREQFPLKLAYAITIHKSQGMSLDKLAVDCSDIFEKGQLYVALSRIKSLDGLYLYNFDVSKIKVDDKVADFYQNLNS